MYARDSGVNQALRPHSTTRASENDLSSERDKLVKLRPGGLNGVANRLLLLAFVHSSSPPFSSVLPYPLSHHTISPSADALSFLFSARRARAANPLVAASPRCRRRHFHRFHRRRVETLALRHAVVLANPLVVHAFP